MVNSTTQSGTVPLPRVTPPSKFLKVFLLLALLLTGAAYIAGEWTDAHGGQTLSSRVRRTPHSASRYHTYVQEMELGNEAMVRSQFVDAASRYRRALAAESTAEGRVNLGNALLKTGNPDMAFSQFQEALRIDPAYGEAYVAWGWALQVQSKLDEAEQVYQEGLRHASNAAPVHYSFALLLQERRQVALAEQRQEDANGQAPSATRARAEAEFFASDADKHFAAAQQLGLKDPGFQLAYGTLLNQQGKYEDAAVLLTKAVAYNPDSAAAQFELATALERLGKYADAIGHFEAALSTRPEDPATLNSLASIYATATNGKVRSPKMGIQLGERACAATSGQNVRYMDTLGRAYAADGDFPQAIAWEDKAVQRAGQLSDHALLLELQPRLNLFVQHKTE